jgi:hypothetical protein
MKKVITAFIFCFLCGECFSQVGEWVWIKGSSTPGNHGHYGTQGIPAQNNNPPAIYEGCEWKDLNGNFWLFGCWSILGAIADLWKYEPLTNEWTWMKGSGIPNDTGSYGIQGVSSPSNNPPSRIRGTASWTDNQGNLWLFGGDMGYPKSDLWKYSISTNEWTWMKGPNVPNQPGIYGIQGIPSTLNNPPSRTECASSWTDNSGNLWLFGGFYIAGFLNDLWKYDVFTNEWTWMKGDSLINRPSVFGIKGIENSTNIPHSRCAYNHSKDGVGNIWLFGGTYWYADYNDLWRFNPNTNNWAWMNGDSIGNSYGVYGTKCIESSTNVPSARFENRAGWTDSYGNFWTFGGCEAVFSLDSVRNDLWMYCLATNHWIWVSGDNAFNPGGNWGTKGVSSPNNKPNGRAGSVGWSDNNGHLYLFGGSGSYNDLWKFTIDTACIGCSINIGIQENNFTNELLVFPNPTNSSITLSFQSSEKQTIELRIYNTLGKQVYFSKEEIAGGKFEKKINVERFSNGIYFLQVRMKDGNMNRKVIINH